MIRDSLCSDPARIIEKNRRVKVSSLLNFPVFPGLPRDQRVQIELDRYRNVGRWILRREDGLAWSPSAADIRANATCRRDPTTGRTSAGWLWSARNFTR